MPRHRPSISRPATLALALFATGVGGGLHAQGLPIAPKITPNLPGTGDEGGAELPGLEMLVEGSILKGILIPQYDELRRLSSTLRAEKLVLVDRDTIDATRARIEFYHPDESLRGSIDLESARLTQQSILRSDQQVVLQAEDFEATGSGLVYEIRGSRGVLLGPALARFSTDRLTAMNFRPHALAAGSLMLVAAPLAAHPPGTLDATQLEGLNRLAVSAAPAAAEAAADAAANVEKAEADATQADQSLDAFLRRAAVELPAGEAPDLTSAVPDPELPPVRLPAEVRAEGGIFFDSESGILTFLRKVEFTHPQFTLRGADEVKVFVEKKKTQPPPAGPDGAQAEEELEFGDPTKIIATGALVVERKATGPDGRDVKASGRQMVYDLKNGELIIRGGQPWILSDSANGRVIDPDGYIRINVKTGDASFVGRSKAFVETDRPR